jgi:hypothetical protein
MQLVGSTSGHLQTLTSCPLCVPDLRPLNQKHARCGEPMLLVKARKSLLLQFDGKNYKFGSISLRAQDVLLWSLRHFDF